MTQRCLYCGERRLYKLTKIPLGYEHLENQIYLKCKSCKKMQMTYRIYDKMYKDYAEEEELI